ncbi:hypothetical protein LINPERPRIM_LOCUS602 [Linum perenne]
MESLSKPHAPIPPSRMDVPNASTVTSQRRVKPCSTMLQFHWSIGPMPFRQPLI